MKRIAFALITCLFVFSPTFFVAQEDLLSLIEDNKADEKAKKVYATFKTVRIGNAQTVECVKKKHLDFRISHRFGNVYDANNANPINETFQTFLGFDNASDIRISFDYGITDNLSVGLGRSKFNRLVDGNLKWKILSQTADFKMPVTVALYESIGYTHMPSALLYGGVVKDFPTSELHRISYFSQLIIASKINDWLSLELLPSYLHRNYIRESVNTSSGESDVNGFFSLGFGGRIKLSKRLSVIGDYFYNFAGYYQNNTLAHAPLSLGIEIETGGHVFSLFYTNAGALVENNYLPNTTDSWAKGQVKFGFCIARTFAL